MQHGRRGFTEIRPAICEGRIIRDANGRDIAYLDPDRNFPDRALENIATLWLRSREMHDALCAVAAEIDGAGGQLAEFTMSRVQAVMDLLCPVRLRSAGERPAKSRSRSNGGDVDARSGS